MCIVNYSSHDKSFQKRDIVKENKSYLKKKTKTNKSDKQLGRLIEKTRSENTGVREGASLLIVCALEGKDTPETICVNGLDNSDDMD